MTLPRLNAMLKRWEKVPPVSESVAAFFGSGNSAPNAQGARPASQAISGKKLTNADLVRDMHADPRMLNWKSIPNG